MNDAALVHVRHRRDELLAELASAPFGEHARPLPLDERAQIAAGAQLLDQTVVAGRLRGECTMYNV